MKKRPIILLLSVVLIMASLPLAFAHTTSRTFKLGDVDMNDLVTASDARSILRHSARLDNYFNDTQLIIADVNGDKFIHADDARLALRVSARLEAPRYVEIRDPEEPVSEEPSSEEPISEEPEPISEEPISEEPISEEPVSEEPISEEPISEEPVSEEPVSEEPISEEPISEEPGSEEPVSEEPSSDEPVSEEPISEEPISEEPVSEEPVSEEPVSEEPVSEEPSSDPQEQIDASDAVIAVNGLNTLVYTGEPIAPEITVTFNGASLTEDVDFIVSYSDNVNTGTGHITVTFINKYKGEATVDFFICSLDMSSAIVSLPATEYEYTGEEITPPVDVVTPDGQPLVAGVDYVFEYIDNVNVGTATVRVVFTGNYAGETSCTFEIVPVGEEPVSEEPSSEEPVSEEPVSEEPISEEPISEEPVSEEPASEEPVSEEPISEEPISEEPISEEPVSEEPASEEPISEEPASEEPISEEPGSEEPVSEEPVSEEPASEEPVSEEPVSEEPASEEPVSEEPVSEEPSSEEPASEEPVSEEPASEEPESEEPVLIDASSAEISAIDDQTFTGSPITPAITVTFGDEVLTEGTDYEVSYDSNVNVGRATVLVTFTGGYYGTASTTFEIRPADASAARIDEIPAQPYKGVPCTPELSIYYGATPLVKDVDYVVSYIDNDAPGTAHVSITFINNYTGAATTTFSIITVSIPSQTYTGSAIIPEYSIVIDGVTLTEGRDYTVELSDNVNVGTATLAVTFIGNYTGTANATFEITAYDASAATIAPVEDQPYTGTEIEPALTITLPGFDTLVAGTDYTVTYSDNIDIGEATAAVTFTGNFSGTAEVRFNIVTSDISEQTNTIVDQIYTGSPIEPSFTVSLDGRLLQEGTDYTVAYSDNVNVGQATATVTFIGSFSGSKTMTFNIVPKNASAATISDIPEQTFTGSAIEPAFSLTLDGATLVRDVDYSAAILNNVNQGTAGIIVTYMGNYTGTSAFSFTVSPLDATDIATVGAISAQTYTGAELCPTPTVSVNGTTLVAGTDFTCSYADNVNAGTATATISFAGNYSGSASAEFTITQFDASADAAIAPIAPQTFNRHPLEPDAAITLNGRLLVLGTDYELSYTDNVNVGTATVAITFIGNYTGTAETTFDIEREDLTSSAFVASIANQVYTSEPIEPPVSILLSDGTALIEGTDFTAAYSSNVDVGTASVHITYIGNYTGSANAIFTIVERDGGGAVIT